MRSSHGAETRERPVLVGTPADDDACPQTLTCNSGSAYLFDLAPDAIQYGSCASSAPCSNTDQHGGCINSSGQGAVLSAGGSSSVSVDDLRFEVSHLPPSINSIFFMGQNQAGGIPLGNGLRVVAPGGSGLFRFSVQQASPQGVLVRGPGLIGESQLFLPAGHIQPGQTWNFQLWYRDPAGPCGGFTNLSNGISVAFAP